MLAMFKRYALALALTAVAILLTALLSTMLARSIFLLYFIAVGAIAWRAGLVPALASTAVFIATALLLRFPRLLAPTNTRDVIRVLAWGTIAALFSWLMSYKRRSDARRRANEELYHAIMARESDGIIITDSDGMVLEANAGALAMLGYAERELIGKRLADLIPTEDGTAAGLFSVGLATQSRRLRRNDGAYIPVEGTGSRISATRFLSIFRDMSERERISEALTSSERKLRLIAEHTVDVIYAFDMERRPIYVNSAFEHSTGYRIDELHAGSLPSILHPDDRERWSLLCDRVFAGHGFQNEEVRIITRDGQVRWLLCSWGPIHDEEGRQIGVQGRDHDITARRQTEHALRQSEERLRLAQRAADAGVWE